MLSPDYLGHCADGIDVLFKRLSDSVVSDMCRRITRMDFSITDSTVWQAERLQEAGLLMDDVAALVASTLGQSKKEVKRALLDAGVQTLNFDDAIYRKAGLKPTPLRYSPAMMQMLNATVNKTSGSIQNMAMSTAGTAYSSFLDSVDLVYMQVSSGALSYDQAIANAVRDLSAKGVTVVEYYNRAGKQLSRRDQIDVATRRAVLTGVQQTTDQLQWMRADEMGCDLMELTAHGGARPDHAAWQGRIVSRSGRKGYLSLADIGYGTPGGFQGINCRHGWFPFFEGISERNYTNAELDAMKNQSVTYNGETLSDYKASQKQREMEVEVRSLKRQLVGERAAIDSATYPSVKERLTNNFNETATKLKNKEAELKDFTRQTGLRRQREREQVVGFGRSTAQKAVWADKRASGHSGAGNSSILPGSTNCATIKEANAIDAFRETIEHQKRLGMPDAYAETLVQRFSAGTDTAKMAFVKHVPTDSIADGSYSGIAHYQPSTRKISMDFAQDATNSVGAGFTYYHENGHLVDFSAGGLSTQGQFGAALKGDYQEFVTSYMRADGILRKPEAYAKLGVWLRGKDADRLAPISDLLGGISSGKITGAYGHRPAYWKRAPFSLEREAFAHMFEAQFDPERLALFEQVFPTALSEFIKLLGGVI